MTSLQPGDMESLPKPPIFYLALSGMGTSLMYWLEYPEEQRVTIGMAFLLLLIWPQKVTRLPHQRSWNLQTAARQSCRWLLCAQTGIFIPICFCMHLNMSVNLECKIPSVSFLTWAITPFSIITLENRARSLFQIVCQAGVNLQRSKTCFCWCSCP